MCGSGSSVLSVHSLMREGPGMARPSFSGLLRNLAASRGCIHNFGAVPGDGSVFSMYGYPGLDEVSLVIFICGDSVWGVLRGAMDWPTICVYGMTSRYGGVT